jgi:hypothetical protein
VADTYNNKVKSIDPDTGNTKTIAGSGRPGKADSPAQFDEPAGIAATDGKLFVADTNNHEIRVVDLAADHRVSTLSIRGLEPPKPPAANPRSSLAGAAEEKLEPVSVRPENGAIRLEVSLALPTGYEINAQAPMSYSVQPADGNHRSSPSPLRLATMEKLTRVEQPASSFAITVPVESASGDETLQVGLTYYYCRHGDEGLCKVGSVVWTVPVHVTADAQKATIPLRHEVR